MSARAFAKATSSLISSRRKSDRRFQRVSDHVVEIEARKTLALGEAVWMDDDKSAELFCFGPKGSEQGVGQFPASNIRENLHALQSKMAYSPFKLIGRLDPVRHWNGAKRDEIGLVFAQRILPFRCSRLD